MGWFIMPVRTREEGLDKDVDDYVIWSTVNSLPVFRGTRQEIRDFWREEFGRRGLASFNMGPSPFASADKFGSDSHLDGVWGESIRVGLDSGAGMLPRERLREFCDLYFFGFEPVDGVARKAKLSSLLEPFDWEGEDDEDTPAEMDGDGS